MVHVPILKFMIIANCNLRFIYIYLCSSPRLNTNNVRNVRNVVCVLRMRRYQSTVMGAGVNINISTIICISDRVNGIRAEPCCVHHYTHILTLFLYLYLYLHQFFCTDNIMLRNKSKIS